MNCKSILAEEVEVETLVATTLLLITNYARDQDKQLIRPIIEHFNWITRHPDLIDSQLKNTCSRLARYWGSMQVERREEVRMNSYHKFSH